MLTLTFYQKSQLDISNEIPEVWRDKVSQRASGASGYEINVEVQPEDSSYRYRALMQKPQLQLKFNLPFYLEFPVGTFCTFQNQKFMLTRAQDLKKQGTRKIEYTMMLGTNEDYFSVWKLRNIVDAVLQEEGAPKDNRLKFSYCAKPHEFIELIVRNLNKKDSTMTWERGVCIEASEKTIEFNHTYIDAALNDVCNTFNTEYEVEYMSQTHAKIHLRRVEYFKDQPVALSYGRGNGFIPGVGRTSEADGVPVKRMLVQGSDRNIDRASYGSPELLLPKSQTIRFDGTHFEGEDGFNANIARTYQSNADGDGVERIDVVSDATKEESLDCSEIYPSRVGVVTDVVVVNEDKNFYDMIDETIPEDLNFNNYLIAGETMTMIMQDGMLAGKEFDVRYVHKPKDNKKGRRFEIVPQEIDGVTMPNKIWCPQKDQKYAIFGIQLPDEYICNNATKTGASWDMMREAVRALYDCEDQKFTFSGTLQALWAKKRWLEIGGRLVVGGHVFFTDNQFAKNSVNIRIVGIKDFLTDPYAPTIELSNSVSNGSSVSSQLRQIENVEVVIDDAKNEIIQYTKRRFRDALETIGMLDDARLDGFSGSISPVAIQTMALLVGDESLQFKFVGLSNDTWVNRNGLISYDQGKKQLICNMSSAGMQIYLQHMTLGQSSITSAEGRSKADYKRWQMKSFTSPVLDEPQASYYLYAKVSSQSTNEAGEFVLSPVAIAMEQEANYYHLLCGVLNSEFEGERSFVTLYGFTEILPGRITTDLIISSDGESYFNIEDNKFKLGDKLSFNLNGDNVLRLYGAFVQSPSGSEAPLPCYRGAYSSTTRYYRGDVVTYSLNGMTSSYMCKTAPATGIINIPPVNHASSGTYWQVYAQGSKGDKGEDGKNGTNGLDAPILVFRGNWDRTKTYFGNKSRVDCVKDGNAFFVARTDATEGDIGFRGQETNNDEYWKPFGGSFESVATSLLLAENATIGNWFISGDNIVSTHGTVNGVESDDFTNANFRPDVVLDGATGELVLYADRYPRVRISNQSVATLFNESMVNEAKISRYGSKNIGSCYVPVGSSDYYYSNTVGLLFTLPIGLMNEGSKITISDFSINFYVPGHSQVSSATVRASVNGTDLLVYIKRDGRIVATLKGGSGTSTTSPNMLSISMGANGYTVPEGGAGNYTVEFHLASIQFSSTSSGNLSSFYLNYNVQGSYVHGGFNRTVIGNDGIGSFWNKAAMVFSQNGFQVKCGTIGFKVDESGIKKATGWVNDNPVWKDINAT